jgi:hypothetical protein
MVCIYNSYAILLRSYLTTKGKRRYRGSGVRVYSRLEAVQLLYKFASVGRGKEMRYPALRPRLPRQ